MGAAAPRAPGAPGDARTGPRTPGVHGLAERARHGPGDAAYGLTKAGLLAWCEALRAEIRGRGVGVTAMCPGFVRTGLFERGTVRDARFLERVRSAPGFVGLRPERVARATLRAVERGRPVVHLGAERISLWLKHVSVRAYDAYNGLLARATLDPQR